MQNVHVPGDVGHVDLQQFGDLADTEFVMFDQRGDYPHAVAVG